MNSSPQSTKKSTEVSQSPVQDRCATAEADKTLVIACGALAKEIVALIKLNQWQHIKVQCLPADLHNRPQLIPQSVDAMLTKTADQYPHRFVAYADCGTGGLLDEVCQKHAVDRLPGAHCYAFFAGLEQFDALMEAELGTFFLTDFMVRHFDRIIWQGMGLDKHPELLDMYFAHYKKVVYLAQTEDANLQAKAAEQARRLGLIYEMRRTGYGELATSLGGIPVHSSSTPNS